MASETTIKIYIKEVGQEVASVTAKPSDTSLDLKTKLGLSKGVSLRFRGKTVPNAVSMEQAGVKEGCTLAAFSTTKPPEDFDSRKQYVASKRLQAGTTMRSTKHHDLHRQTQAVVLEESALICKTVRETGERLLQDVKKTIANDTVPLNKSQREWAEKLNPLPVSTLNEVLDKVSLPRKGNKFMKVMRLATEVEPRNLNKLLQAALPDGLKSQSTSTPSESSSAAAGKVEEQKKDKTQTHSKGRASKQKKTDTKEKKDKKAKAKSKAKSRAKSKVKSRALAPKSKAKSKAAKPKRKSEAVAVAPAVEVQDPPAALAPPAAEVQEPSAPLAVVTETLAILAPRAAEAREDGSRARSIDESQLKYRRVPAQVLTSPSHRRVQGASTSPSPSINVPETTDMLFAFWQCSLKMEAQHFMSEADFVILKDPLAISMWPKMHAMCSRNLGPNEKWVPFHTVLGVHEMYVVQNIHHSQVDEWDEYRRFVLTFIFRAHCKQDLFDEVQVPLMKSAAFWKDPCKAFEPGSAMEIKS